MKKYKYPKTPELIAALRSFWKQKMEAERVYRWALAHIEAKMQETTGIKDVEFIEPLGEVGIIGIGNFPRTMEFIDGSDLVIWK